MVGVADWSDESVGTTKLSTELSGGCRYHCSFQTVNLFCVVSFFIQYYSPFYNPDQNVPISQSATGLTSNQMKIESILFLESPDVTYRACTLSQLTKHFCITGRVPAEGSFAMSVSWSRGTDTLRGLVVPRQASPQSGR